ncbi:cap-specific mRNA (nucleoside-2'-O-)-methyltransferase 2 [Anabrus simplex]|uniref:cap-specific mRNA (nucleoside-2'-O-)-methyltransferase 2 n=1 Tax=Anabrus simplex TaxID=316456 RepID=UPI0035A297B8
MADAAFSSGDYPQRKDVKHTNSSAASQWRQKNSSDGNVCGPYGDLPTKFGSSRGSHDRFTRNDYEKLEEVVNNYFNKKFFFQPPLENWKLPDPELMYKAQNWMLDDFQQLKQELNDVKNKLNDYNLDEWHKHTRAMNKAGEIQWKLKKEFEPEFVTQAWCKFYENAMAFPLVPAKVVKTEKFFSVHLCEAPGAFITSLNHHLKLNFPSVKWDWIATTLNPYYEGNPLSCMINDDRFILQTLEHWDFGRDFTGDLMNLKNLKHLLIESRKIGEVHLVTADGSIDCQEDPGEQESIVSPLHYCEAITALHILGEGGSFLLKMFTMYEHETICLMYLLCCSFKAVRVFKPATSKEGNSEVYVVCLEYRGAEYVKKWLAVLRKHFGPQLPSEAMFPLECIPEDFLSQLYRCASMFKKLQVNVIENNIRAFTKGRDPIIRKLRFMISNHFMEHYDMKKLNEDDEVVGKVKLKETQTLNLDPRTDEGSFNDRCKKKQMSPVEQLQFIQEDLENMNIKWPFDEDIKWLKFPAVVEGFNIQTGKPVTTVHSSKFCLGRLLKLRNQVREIAKDISTVSLSSSASVKNCSVESGSDATEKNPLVHLVMKECNLKDIKNVEVLNFKEDLWSSMEAGHNEEAELEAFKKIIETVDRLWRDQYLFIQGYPLLTQFNVGIIYMLSHMFSKVGFIRPNKQDFAVIFVGFNSWNQKMFKFLEEVEDMLNILQEEGGSETVLAVMPIFQLCGKRPDPKEEKKASSRTESEGDIEEFAVSVSEFYTCVTEVNHLCVKEQISDIIDNIKQ